MALNYDLRKVKDYKKLYRKLTKGEIGYIEDEVLTTMRSVPQSIIFSTMYVGIREITEKNYEQFFNRINLHEKVFGTNFYHTKRKKLIPTYTTIEDIKGMIGLHTNASSYTKSQFLTKLFKNKNL